MKLAAINVIAGQTLAAEAGLLRVQMSPTWKPESLPMWKTMAVVVEVVLKEAAVEIDTGLPLQKGLIPRCVAARLLLHNFYFFQIQSLML
mmetsp:Transcript_15254/g.32929  ORF Transcript_15254/g.32929 Transcript_15254/m.32929 type:complete len:90 (-) Transcript_15254:951-1220(-)